MPTTPPPSTSRSPPTTPLPTTTSRTPTKRKRCSRSSSTSPVPQPRAQHTRDRIIPAWLHNASSPSPSLSPAPSMQPHHVPDEDRAATNSPRTAVSQRLEELKLKGYLTDDEPSDKHSASPSPSPYKGKSDPLTPPSLSPPSSHTHPPSRQNVEVEGTPSKRCRPMTPIDESPGWWSEAEITGHLGAAADGEDDGTGMNGIGFRPTAQQEARRVLRRKRQVREWREREGREERGRRARRRLGNGDDEGEDGKGTPTPRKVVRFA